MAISTDQKRQNQMQQERQRAGRVDQQRLDQQRQEQKEQTAATAKSGQIIRSQRSLRRQQETTQKQLRDQHDRLKHKQEQDLEARDNRLAISRQNAAVKANQLAQTNLRTGQVSSNPADLAPENELASRRNPTGATTSARGSLVQSALSAGLLDQDPTQATESAIRSISSPGRQNRQVSGTVEAPVVGVEATATVDVSSIPGTDLSVDQVVNLSDLAATPQQFGGSAALEAAAQAQINQFVQFLTSAFQKKSQVLDPVEEAFSVLRWALMLEAIGQLAQNYILESASAAGMDADTIRKMVANAVRVIEQKELADSDFVAVLDEELKEALQEDRDSGFYLKPEDDGDESESRRSRKEHELN